MSSSACCTEMQQTCLTNPNILVCVVCDCLKFQMFEMFECDLAFWCFLDFLCRLVWSHTLFASRCRSHGYHATAATLAMRCPSMEWGVMETEWKAKTGRISLLTRSAATVRLAYAVSRSVKKLESWRFRLKKIQINTVYTLYIHRIYWCQDSCRNSLFVELE